MPGANDQHEFDPYYHWLGIPPDEQPADHYRLLGLQRFETDTRVIESAADRQMNHVRSFQLSSRKEASQRVLNELAAARLCLLSPAKKQAYDTKLRKDRSAATAHQVNPDAELQASGSGFWLALDSADPFGFTARPNNTDSQLQQEPRTLRAARPHWQRRWGKLALAATFIGIFAISYLLGAATTPPRDNDSAATEERSRSLPEDLPIENGQSDVSHVQRRVPDPPNIGPQVSESAVLQQAGIDEPPLIAPSSQAGQIRNLLRDAMVMYQFEAGSYSAESSTGELQFRDQGPGRTDAISIGEPTLVPGIAGQAISFDGLTQSLTIPSLWPRLIRQSTPLTISLWQRTESPKKAMLFECGFFASKTLGIVHAPDRRIELHYGIDILVYSPRRVTVGSWRHYAMVHDWGSLRFYVDGELYGFWETAPTSLNKETLLNVPARIGTQAKTPSREERHFHGQVDEFVILSRACTQEEIKLLYEWTRDGNVLPTISDE